MNFDRFRRHVQKRTKEENQKELATVEKGRAYIEKMLKAAGKEPKDDSTYIEFVCIIEILNEEIRSKSGLHGAVCGE